MIPFASVKGNSGKDLVWPPWTYGCTKTSWLEWGHMQCLYQTNPSQLRVPKVSSAYPFFPFEPQLIQTVSDKTLRRYQVCPAWGKLLGENWLSDLWQSGSCQPGLQFCCCLRIGLAMFPPIKGEFLCPYLSLLSKENYVTGGLEYVSPLFKHITSGRHFSMADIAD